MQALFAIGLLWQATAAAAAAVTSPGAGNGNPGVARSLLVSITPDPASKTVQFDDALRANSPDIAPDDPRITKKAPGCVEPEQVSVTYWSATSVLVSWATCDAQVGTKVTPPVTPPGGDVSMVAFWKLQGGGKGAEKTAKGVVTSYINDYSPNGFSAYASPRLHHVVIKGLEPGASYGYRLRGEGPGATSREFNFTMPKGSFPFRLGVVADPGQTYNTSEVLKSLIASKPQMLVIGGDFSYADKSLNETEGISDEMHKKFTFQPKWDTWGRLFEPLLSGVPFVHTHGNHEIEPRPDKTLFASYNARHPVPTGKPVGRNSFTPVSQSNPFNNLYYSIKVPGLFHYIFLTSYSPNQTFGAKSDKQYSWLQKELKQVNRAKTPWLLVTFHSPWYNSYKSHFKEAECMRTAYEPLLLRYGVDIVISGHTHAYERSKPVANHTVSECGPVYITVGDGGNIEGLAKSFIDTVDPAPAYCANPYLNTQFPGSQPQACYSFQDGSYCPKAQPAWSAFRQPSFGHGMLEFKSAKEAVWTWNKIDWPGGAVPADVVTIARGALSKDCAALG